MSKPRIQVIIGTVREGGFGGPIGRWFYELASARDDIEVELIDLKDWDLPIFAEPVPPSEGIYTGELQRSWAEKVAQADGYVFLAAEYNHGYPAALKNAIDYVFAEWALKPIAFVGYGNAGGARSVEQLRQVAVELNAVPIRNQVAILAPWNLVQDGTFEGARFVGQANRLLDQLTWWASTLRTARETSLPMAA